MPTITALLTKQTRQAERSPQLFGTPATYDFTTHPGNPQVTVTLQRTDVPLFFARIFWQESRYDTSQRYG